MNTVKRTPERPRVRVLVASACAAAVLAGCASPAPPEPATAATSEPITTPQITPPPTTPPPPTPPPPTPPPPAPEAPRGPVVSPITAEELGATWRPECPVTPEQLRRIELDYLGLDTVTHRGAIVVHEELVDEVIAAFDRLYQLGFPIERMQTVDHYGGADDELSMRDNNTSAFNCRDIPGTGRWSYHAYGRAIDVNPRFNPYIDSAGEFQPANAEVYLDRNRIDPGLFKDGDAAVRAFTDHGWSWGGYWRTPKDYQHFEMP